MKIDPIPPMNFRLQRAKALANSIMGILDDYLPRSTREDAYDALLRLFHETDAEIITETDRTRAGLPPRNAFGLSPDEHQAIEARRALILTAPPAPLIFCAGCPHAPTSNTPLKEAEGRE